jgi:hypothetical protein
MQVLSHSGGRVAALASIAMLADDDALPALTKGRA